MPRQRRLTRGEQILCCLPLMQVGGDCISIQGCEGPDHALRLRKELEASWKEHFCCGSGQIQRKISAQTQAICGYYGFPAPQWG